jgi:hypothetical protein
LQWGPINEEESDAETFGCRDWLVSDDDMIALCMKQRRKKGVIDVLLL